MISLVTIKAYEDYVDKYTAVGLECALKCLEAASINWFTQAHFLITELASTPLGMHLPAYKKASKLYLEREKEALASLKLCIDGSALDNAAHKDIFKSKIMPMVDEIRQLKSCDSGTITLHSNALAFIYSTMVTNGLLDTEWGQVALSQLGEAEGLLGLHTAACEKKFRNISLWTLGIGAVGIAAIVLLRRKKRSTSW